MPETPREIIEAWTDSDPCAKGLWDDLREQGYVIVPREPTPKMVAAGWGAHRRCPDKDSDIMEPIYEAMIEAADCATCEYPDCGCVMRNGVRECEAK